MRLDGDVAIVTGGSSGIGRAISRLFAREGATVAVADLQPESRLDEETPDTVRAICNAGGTAIFVETDVSDTGSVEHAIDAVASRYGRIDILVNCAGIFQRNPITDVTDDEWLHVINTNLGGYFRTCRAVLPHMLRHGDGRIVNVSSIHGIRGTGAAATYCASKGGIENLTKQIAVEFAPKNIRVNAVAPGTIRTAMCLPFMNTPALREEYERRTLLPRLGAPDDVAYAALFLGSRESGFVVGHTLVVDGGWTIT
jgi:NAD(P)-dependent dehydrogenase (short-subunit alcohol dehydrogenase family)